MAFIDITHPHANGLAPWPGDTAFHYQLTSRIADGKICNIGEVRTGIHSGTHIDAPYHYNDRGIRVDELPLELLIGPARVFDARGRDPIPREVFAGLDARATPRVLVRTNSCDNKAVFPDHLPLLAPEVPAWLGAQGVKLIGLDVPSVDQVDTTTIPMHRLFDAAGIIILENLDLRNAPPGNYELIVLPLRIQGADGSPVRAVLRT